MQLRGTSSRSLNTRGLGLDERVNQRGVSVASQRVTAVARTRVVGVDGCPTGWVGVVLATDLPPAAVWAAGIAELAAQTPDVAVIAIDIPIGLPDHDTRPADLAARKALGRRWQTVFPTPVRRAIEAATYDEANRLARKINNAGISRQAYALQKKILEVDQWISTAPCAVYEVHPELSFAHLAGTPVTASKKTWAGSHERQRLLQGAGISLEGDLGIAGLRAGRDDVLDAAAAAWTAQRIAAGTAVHFGEPRPIRGSDHAFAIWA